MTEDTHWNTRNMIYGYTDEMEMENSENIIADKKIFDANNTLNLTKLINKPFDPYHESLEKQNSAKAVLTDIDKQEMRINNLKEFVYLYQNYPDISDITAILQSSNLYVYCINNPIMAQDPSGHFAFTSAIVGGGALLLAGITFIVGLAANDPNIQAAKKYQKPPNPNRRKGAENRGPNPDAPGKNEQHGDCENHSQRPKGGTKLPQKR